MRDYPDFHRVYVPFKTFTHFRRMMPLETGGKSALLPRIGRLCEETPRGVELGDGVGGGAAGLPTACRVNEVRAAFDRGRGGRKVLTSGVSKEVRRGQPDGAARSGAVRAVGRELRQKALDFLPADAIGRQGVIDAVARRLRSSRRLRRESPEP